MHENLKIVDIFLAAWERADVEALLALMQEDCVYSASVGAEPGNTIKGKERIRAELPAILLGELDGEQGVGRKWISGDFVFVEWTYEKIATRGDILVIRGLDVIHIVGGKIAVIDAYRKSTV